jgi:taurine dioxygenase
VRIEPLTPAVGALVHGVELSGQLDEALVGRLRTALLEHLVLFFRDQEITPGEQIDFARRFGELDRYPLVTGLAEHPEIVAVTKREDERDNFGGVWHSDTTYLAEPPMGAVLYARELPPVGGDTLFANMVLAYETLSCGMRRLLDGLRAVNSASKPEAAAGRSDRRAERPTDTEERRVEAVHPVVRTHPETRPRSLFVNRGHTVRFEGWTEAESRPLLEFLFTHQLRPEFGCRFRWAPGSLAIWDNRAAQHYAVNDYHGFRRLMHRVVIKGERPV